MAMLGVFESVANQIHDDALPGADIGAEVPGYRRLNVDEDGDVVVRIRNVTCSK